MQLRIEDMHRNVCVVECTIAGGGGGVQGFDFSVVGSDVRLIWKSEIDVLEVLESLAHETEG